MKTATLRLRTYGQTAAAVLAAFVCLDQASPATEPAGIGADVEAANLTATCTARLRGTTRFGSLGEDVCMDGFRVDVIQSATQRMREIVTPGATRTVTTYQPIFAPTYNHWVETTGHIGYETVMTDPGRDAYTIDTEVVDEEAVPAHWGEYYTTTNIVTQGVAAYDETVHTGTYDEDGNEIVEIIHHDAVPTVYEEARDWIPATPAVTHQEPLYFSAVPPQYEERMNWVVDTLVEHDDYLGEQQIGEEPVVTTTTDPDTITTESYTDYATPMARFTGTRPGLAWVWRNWEDSSGASSRDLMTLSEGGLLLPNPAPGAGNYNASLSYNKFEQSWSGPQQIQNVGILYRTFGSSMEKDKIRVWNSSGNYQAGNTSQVTPDQDTVEIASDGVTVKSDAQGSGSTVQSQVTHIKSTFATFAGNVAVKGVLRVQPAGDIDMGAYTAGPQP